MIRRRILALTVAALLAPAAIAVSVALPDDGSAHCRVRRNDDSVRSVPPSMAERAARALDVRQAEILENPERFVYRCMNGKTWACDHGANITCAKADARKRMQSVDDYCKSNPDGFVPMYVTGHGSIHSWKCENGKALIADSQRVDERGFVAEHWRSLD